MDRAREEFGEEFGKRADRLTEEVHEAGELVAAALVVVGLVAAVALLLSVANAAAARR